MQTLLRKIGFEVEFSCPVNPLSEINRVLQRMAEPVTLAGYYRHSVGSAWDLKLDGSCGYEIASPIIDSYESLVKASKIVDIVKRAGGTATLVKIVIQILMQRSLSVLCALCHGTKKHSSFWLTHPARITIIAENSAAKTNLSRLIPPSFAAHGEKSVTGLMAPTYQAKVLLSFV